MVLIMTLALELLLQGNQAIVDPKNKVYLYVEKGGQNTSGSIIGLPARFFRLLLGNMGKLQDTGLNFYGDMLQCMH